MLIDQQDKSRIDAEIRMMDGVAVLTIRNPPVNAGSHAVRKGLADGLAAAVRNGASGAVIVGDGRCFMAGSDLKEFGKKLEWPELPDVIRLVEDAPFPVVAAMHGVALGGGLELALGCDYRLAAPGTMVGLPEVSLGFVPGAGGTQRLPRLTGLVHGIDLICAARRIPADQAATIGLVDRVVEGDLLAGALAFLAGAARPKRLTMALTPPADDPVAIDAAADKALHRGKGRPNVAEAIRLIRRAAEGDGADALADERAVFQRLRVGEDATALRHLFFSERRAAAVDGLDMGLARAVGSVGVIGGGTMGQGIVRCFLAAGLPVTLVERDRDALARAMSGVRGSLDAALEKGRLTPDEAARRKAAVTGATGYDALSGCDLAIEAVFEDMQVKRDVLGRLERVLAPDAILATNTSYLDIDAMAEGLAHRGRVVGLHFFSPADVMPLLEVVRTDMTDNATLATALKLARKLGKQPVVARVAEGFIGNRIYAAYRRRAELLVLDGANPEQVDRAATAFGFAMGPFAVADMSGLDIAWAMRKRQAPTRDPRARYVTIPDTLCEIGRLGRKTGGGWYDYPQGKPVPSEQVAAVIAKARQAAGVVPVGIDDDAIQRQLLAAIVNEAALLLEQGVAQRPSDVDVTLCNGYGFPRWRGGPLWWAAHQDRAAIRDDQARLADAIGYGFVAGPVDRMLDSIVSEHKG
ncbi:3-hydroxyacyl-CoA dehydrogenase NAD-binding domain-containing protein [Martelella soudanensis]|uniref:3-hydroxyacyl-CoA dehydrogenase NAD-binding domain-containing protein n=1 Tax=unclassified Martelella TaxID=2629616 RepID=UPI0015DDD8F8|nr:MULTISPECIES: 3-hydroxyacyl-CoA dehydrogenase NAD-binding domain-containing protein [unclassified Martelella]